jgi:hypothetical protein
MVLKKKPVPAGMASLRTSCGTGAVVRSVVEVMVGFYVYGSDSYRSSSFDNAAFRYYSAF